MPWEVVKISWLPQAYFMRIMSARRCSNYTSSLDLTPSFNGLGEDNYKTRRETFKFLDLVILDSEVWRHFCSRSLLHNISIGGCVGSFLQFSHTERSHLNHDESYAILFGFTCDAPQKYSSIGNIVRQDYVINHFGVALHGSRPTERSCYFFEIMKLMGWLCVGKVTTG